MVYQRIYVLDSVVTPMPSDLPMCNFPLHSANMSATPYIADNSSSDLLLLNLSPFSSSSDST